MVGKDGATRHPVSSGRTRRSRRGAGVSRQMKTFSDRLKWALDVRRVSQHALARSTGLTSGEISRMTRGERGERVQYATVAVIARALDIQIEWLGEGRGEKPTPNDQPPDPLPKRAEAVRICREAELPEHALEHARQISPSAATRSWTTLQWITTIQLAATAPSAPASPPAVRSVVRPRADTLPPTRRSSPMKK